MSSHQPIHNKRVVGVAFVSIILGLVVAVITTQKPTTPIETNPTSPSTTNLPATTPTPIPQSKVLNGSRHIFQTFNNCGPAALSMALSLYGQYVTQAELGSQLRPYQNQAGDNDDKSVTLAELALVATDYDLVPYHRPMGSIEIVQQFVANDIPVITRTWLKVGEDIGHYRVVKGYDLTRQVLIQDDSLQGRDLEYTEDEFDALWQAFGYEFLVLVPQSKISIAEAILGDKIDKNVAWQQALQVAQTASVIDPNNVYPAFNQVVAHYHLGQYQQAVSIYESIADKLPSRMLWYQIEPILSYYRLGRYDVVLSMTERILGSHNQAFSELHHLRGTIFESQGQTSMAKQSFDSAKHYNTGIYWETNLE